jgi:hypothetical protein
MCKIAVPAFMMSDMKATVMFGGPGRIAPGRIRFSGLYVFAETKNLRTGAFPALQVSSELLGKRE